MVSQKSLFAKVALFTDEFEPCEKIAQSILQNTSCVTILPLSEVENTLKSLDEVDLVVFVSRIVQRGKITDPPSAIATTSAQFVEAVGQGKKIIYLSGHNLYLVPDSMQQCEEIAREIEAFSHAVA